MNIPTVAHKGYLNKITGIHVHNNHTHTNGISTHIISKCKHTQTNQAHTQLGNYKYLHTKSINAHKKCQHTLKYQHTKKISTHEKNINGHKKYQHTLKISTHI